MEDPIYLSECRRLAAQARFVTSVCTASLLLAAARLLHGKRAACHWAWREMLTDFGVTPDPARIVRNGNVISGGGVTAEIDMALTVMAEIAGVDHAQTVQLALEYAPGPAFDCERPERARLDSSRAVRDAAVQRALRSMRGEVTHCNVAGAIALASRRDAAQHLQVACRLDIAAS